MAGETQTPKTFRGITEARSVHLQMSHYLGISAGYHDAAVSVVSHTGDIVFASHSERYSGVKNDSCLDRDLLQHCMQWKPRRIALYERPWAHNLQQVMSGQHCFGPWTARGYVKKYLETCWNSV